MWESIKVHQISNLKIIGTITFENKGMQEKIVTPAKQKNVELSTFISYWSGRQDLNLQPLGPKPSALPSWATSR